MYMKNQRLILRLSILLISVINPDLKAEYKFEGVYTSKFLLPFNRVYAGDLKCPKKLPIQIEIKVEANKIKGNISNSSNCPNYQRALINGEIDDEGNIVRIKFNHYDKKWGPKDDAYKIVGNLSGELILKSKQRKMYKDHSFSFTAQNLSDINEKFVDEIKTNNLENEKQLKILEETRLKKLEEKQLKELEETRLKELEETRLKELKEIQLKEQKRIKKKTNLLFN